MNLKDYIERSFPSTYSNSIASYLRASAFVGSGPSSITMQNCKYIERDAFASNSYLRYASFETCKIIGTSAFSQCSNLSTLYIPQCEYIEHSAFTNCSSITSISIPECKVIGNSAFYGCGRLSSVYAPKCEFIGSEAFRGTQLYAFVADNIKDIGYSAFAYCNYLQSISLSQCRAIGSYAFASCNRLTQVVSPECSQIGNSAFYNCTSISRAEAPNCLIVGTAAFAGCNSLASANFSNCEVIGNFAFQNIVSLSKINLANCVIIGNYAFSNTRLISINLNECRQIGSYAFVYNYSLTNARLPKCESISEAAFYACSSLRKVDIPNCTTLGRGVFQDCFNLTAISLPKCVSLYSQTFYNCNRLLSLYLSGSTLCPMAYSHVLQSTPIAGYTAYTEGQLGSIYVLSSMYNDYVSAPVWSYFSERFAIYRELSAPTNVSVNNGVVTWDAVANAEAYYVLADGMSIGRFTARSCTLNSRPVWIDSSIGNHNITVVAIGTGYADSPESNAVVAYNDGTMAPNSYVTFSSPTTFSISTNKQWDGKIWYSVDLSAWQIWNGESISSAVHDASYKIYITGCNNTRLSATSSSGANGKWNISGTNVSASGNLGSVFDWGDYTDGINHVVNTYCCAYMFYQSTALITAPELPTFYNPDGLYSGKICYCMFRECRNLVTGPSTVRCIVPDGKSIGESSFEYMFLECNCLQNAPTFNFSVLNVSYLGNNCLRYVFGSCYALTNMPSFPEFTNATGARATLLEYIFNECNGLKVSTTQTAECPYAWHFGDTITSYNFGNYAFRQTAGTYTDYLLFGQTYYTNLPTVQ